eukprot:CAMPEP_0197023366 /NCGR_PEP_ID=MMETSP1384-20130603/4065_1 /TAXON_ID=29189 /ORGANISM="Ammonia sp." /LENGTH=496 /DNA_ID=CAMNT_0042451563 /DNA_START=214 /DNA_END=1701 /DNA_ORIENTATION=-
MKQESDDEEDEDDDDDDDDDDMLCNDWMELINLESESTALYNILHSTMEGEGNTSVLLFGRNGFGKSSLISYVMHQIEQKFGKNTFIYIYLNANLHTTDIESLYEIVSQLAHQNGKTFHFNLFQNQEAEDQAGDVGNPRQSDKLKKIKKSDFVDNLEFLVEELKKVTMENYEKHNKKNRKPIYIVLDHFELFAKRHKQTLLYNLFDLNQSQSSLLNIIGITNQKSVYELLEKRIRSRFVHKKIFVPQKSFLSHSSFKLFFKIVYNALYIKNYRKYCVDEQAQNHVHIKRMISKYNNWVEAQLLNKSEFMRYLQELHAFGYSPSKFLVIAAQISCMIFTEKYFMKPLKSACIKGIVSSVEQELFEDPFLRMINNLSMNELIILIVAAKFDMTKGRAFNFEIIYQTLQNVRNQDSMMIVMKKHIYFQCYRELIKRQFLVPVANVNKLKVSGSTAASSNNVLCKVFHSNFEMVRLNKMIESGSDILRYISMNVKKLPAW